MKAKDMREKSLEDLRELEKSLAGDTFQSKLKNFTNRLDDTSQIRKVRKDLARVKTLLGELARGAAKPKAAKVAAQVPHAAKSAPDAAKAPAKKRPTKSKTSKSEATR